MKIDVKLIDDGAVGFCYSEMKDIRCFDIGMYWKLVQLVISSMVPFYKGTLIDVLKHACIWLCLIPTMLIHELPQFTYCGKCIQTFKKDLAS